MTEFDPEVFQISILPFVNWERGGGMLELTVCDRSSGGFSMASIQVGCLVTLEALGDGFQWRATIVDSDEADPEADRISDQCPIGVALLGRHIGDTVLVEVPQGTVQYRVISVSGPAHETFRDSVAPQTAVLHPG